MEVSRYVNLFYAVVFLVAVSVFNSAVVMIWEAVERLPDLSIVGNAITLTNVIAVGLAIAVTFWTYRKEEYRTYVSDVVVELKKVTWPSGQETKRATIIVIAFTIALGAFLYVIDLFWQYATNLILLPGS